MASRQVQPSPLKQKFIVLNALSGSVILEDSAVSTARTQVFRGELCESIFEDVDGRPDHPLVSLMSIDRLNTYIECHPGDVRNIGTYAADLLLPVKPYDQRLEILGKNRLDDAVRFDLDSNVTVDFSGSVYPGTIRYVGPLRGKGSGIYFGAELTYHNGHGDSNGSIDGQYYFRCPKDSGVFVTISQLRPLHDRGQTGVPQHYRDDSADMNSDMLRRGLTFRPSSAHSGREIPIHHMDSQQSNSQPKLLAVKRHDSPQLQQRSNHAGEQNFQRADSPQLPPRSQALTPSIPPRQIYPSFPASSDKQHSDLISVVDSEVKKNLGAVGALAYGTASIGTQLARDVRQNINGQNDVETKKVTALAASVLENLPIRLNEKVYFNGNKGQWHRACVRWIGRIDGNQELIGGLECDEPVGDGTGLLKGEQIFVTQPHYAVYVPLTGLVKASDFDHQETDRQPAIPAAGRRPPEPPSYSQVVKTRPPLLVNGISRQPVSRVACNFQQQDAAPVVPLSKESQRDSQRPLVSLSHSHGSLSNVIQPPRSPSKERRKNLLDLIKPPRSPSKERPKHVQLEEVVTKTKMHKKSPSPDLLYDYAPKSPQKQQSTPSSPSGLYQAEVVRNHISNALDLHRDPSAASVPAKSPIIQARSNRLNGDMGHGVISQPLTSSSSVGLRCLHPTTEWGKRLGIQGHKNSCYMDATLFGMFAFSNVFDDMLFRKRMRGDAHGFEEVQGALNEIMVQLRNRLYVPCEDVMRLRELLDEYSQVTGLTDQEKDPEEFLSSLLEQILRIDPLLKLTTCDVNFYTLFVEKNLESKLPTIQELFDLSLITSDVRLKKVPKCLILQTPRSGKEFKMYRQVVPSPTLDLTDAIVGKARACCMCEDVAQLDCKECFDWMKTDYISKLSSTAFCRVCFAQRHRKSAQSHKPTELSVAGSVESPSERVIMELFAVICIETSHYVTFAKDGDGMWYFVDSMADREGGEGTAGFNIPEVQPCPDVLEYLDAEMGRTRLLQHFEANIPLPLPIKRFFEDAYLCMYQPKPKIPDAHLAKGQSINTISAL